MQSFSNPPPPSMSLCVWVCTVWMCVCTLVSASFTLSQPLSHVSMNPNMQLNINHCISRGASYADAPSQITSNEKHAKTRKKRKKIPSELWHWVIFISPHQACLFDYLLQWWMITESGIRRRWRKHKTPSRLWFAVSQCSAHIWPPKTLFPSSQKTLIWWSTYV